jgi:hypothetical protein
MGDVWERRGRTLREIAKAAVECGGRLDPYWDHDLADGWGSSLSTTGLLTQIGKSGELYCPGQGAGRWTITVLDKATGECGVWDFRQLRREMEREQAGEPVQASLL